MQVAGYSLYVVVFGLLLVEQTSALSQTLVVNPARVEFTAAADSTDLPTQKVEITSATGGNVPFSYLGAIGDLGSRLNFVTVSPESGTTPAILTVGLNPAVFATLGLFQYADNLSFAVPPPQIPFTQLRALVTVTPPPTPVIGSMVNAATLQPGPVSADEIVTVFGRLLGPLYNMALPAFVPSSVFPQESYFPSNAGGTQVFFNATPAPILYAANGQVNAVVPSSVVGTGVVDVTVKRWGVESAPFRVNVAESSPGILSLSQNGNGQGVILNTSNTLNDTAHPAPKGSILQMFGTGVGLFDQQIPDGRVVNLNGPFPAAVGPVSVTIGGKAAKVTYAGAAPGFVLGLVQINAMVPLDAESGVQPVVLTVAGNKSNQNITAVIE